MAGTPELFELSSRRWHATGLVATAVVLVLCCVGAELVGDGIDGDLVGRLAVVSVLAALAWFVGADRRRHGWVAVWPVLACAAVAATASVDQLAGSLLLSVFGLSFLFLGLSLPPGRCWWFVLPAVAVYSTVVDLPTDQALVRLPLAAMSWILVSEAPARLIRRLQDNQSELAHLTRHDAMTGLRNRTGFDADVARLTTDDSIAVVDVDLFKVYNDTYGHLAGDRLLTGFADLLDGLRDCTAYRVGGDEFVVIGHSLSPDELEAALTAVVAELTASAEGVSASVGVATGGPGALARADDALYAAKRAARQNG